VTSPAAPVEFELPAERVASEPAEARGLARDEVRLLVARPDALCHTVFRDLGGHLDRGDVLVVNTSPTMPAALDACGDRAPVTVHLSSRLGHGEWIIELRRRDRLGPVLDGMPGEQLTVASGATLTLLAPDAAETGDGGIRLWRARLETQGTIGRLLKRDGRPIRYGYVPHRWPLAAYQTIFAAGRANTFGSAEMPSAARPFTPRLVAALRRRGVNIAPVTLHAGVSSLEAHEAPRPERFAVSWRTAGVVNRARRRGRRVISVGTTAARALETAARPDGTVRAAEGWTDLVLDGARQARVVGGLVTGWHPPQASHLRLLEAVAGPELVTSAYRAAAAAGYLWHEFGDSCLFLPDLA
jgi:S-adenosylmethionine:tRNA ribosyltransferase-isomerase